MNHEEKATLLSSGNPQIPKGDGDGPVQSYITAMPGWKREVGRKVDELVERVFPRVKKAVKWNTPFYGKEDGWFMAMYCYKNYVQLTFMHGALLEPVPPKPSKVQNTRYLNILEGDEWNENQLADWIMQSSKLPGIKL